MPTLTTSVVDPAGLSSTASLLLRAESIGVGGGANAAAQVPLGVMGYDPNGTTSISGSGLLSGNASSDITALASTTGNSLTDLAVATIDNGAGGGAGLNPGVNTIGLNLDAGATDISRALQAIGRSQLKAMTQAGAVLGDAQAYSLANRTTGILLGEGGTAANLTAGTTASITAAATLDLSAQANTTTGFADARTVDLFASTSTAAIRAENSTLSVGDNADITASTAIRSSAAASTANGSNGTIAVLDPVTGGAASSVADATVGIVRGIAGTGGAEFTIDAGQGLSLNVLAALDQKATASSIKTLPTAGSAAVIGGLNTNQAFGMDSTVINVGNSTNSFSSTVTSQAIADSKSVDGFSNASVNNNLKSATTLNLTIGDSANQGLNFTQSSNSTALSSSVAGSAQAVGTGSFAGIDTGNIAIGENAGTVSVIVDNSIASKAASITPTAANSPLTGTSAVFADAGGASASRGISDVGTTIGKDGSIVARVTNTFSADASLITDKQTGGTTSASALTQYDSAAILQATANQSNILIQRDGSVLATTLSNTATTASSVTANTPTTVVSTVTQAGINIGDSLLEVVIGRNGSILGEALAGVSASNPLQSTPLTLNAQSVTANTTATLTGGTNSVSGGLLGAETGGVYSLIKAGSVSGNIVGTSIFNGSLNSGSVDGNATADASNAVGTNPLRAIGIGSATLQAGQQGSSNLIRGSSQMVLDSVSSSVSGDASNIQNLRSTGIGFSDDGVTGTPPATASVSGTLQAVSNIINTSLARSVLGVSTSNSGGTSVGLLGYDVSIPKSGTIIATGTSQFLATAQSVQGNASA